MQQIMRYIKEKFNDNFLSEQLPLEERQINMVYFVGMAGSAFVAIIMALSSVGLMLTSIVFGITAFLLVMYIIMHKSHKYVLISIITAFILCDILFPLAYFPIGGINSGMAAYFALSFVVVFFLTRGTATVILLFTHVAMICLCFWIGDMHPKLLNEISTSKKYINHTIAILASGLCIGVLLRHQKWQYMDSMKKLKKARAEAMQASIAKSDFLSNISHEIRTPLNAIIGMASLAQRADTIERKDYCEKQIIDASAHLLSIINDVLDMSKIEAGKMELSIVCFDFNSMLQRVTGIVKSKMAEKELNFAVETDGDMPEWLKGDEQRLVQVLINLLNNAVKFTPDRGNIKLQATAAKMEADMCTLIFSVQDSGIGISEQQMEKLFTPFTQADSNTTRKYGGTGLGLSICKATVEMMGGRIWAESELGSGSTFSFTVRMKTAQPPGKCDTIKIAGTVGDSEAFDDFSSYSILVAEDVEINREVIEAMLEPTGISMTFVENGEDALKAFIEKGDTFDLIFMDVQMPIMDGYTATRRIRELEGDKPKKIPIIAVTANVFSQDVAKALDAGMDSHIGKPLNYEDLLILLKSYLKE